MTDQSLQPIFSALRYLLVTIGGILAAHGFAKGGEYVQLAAGAVMVVGPAAWGVWTAFKNYRTTHRLATIVSPANPKQAIAAAKAGTP
jgi:hypothetical protein